MNYYKIYPEVPGHLGSKTKYNKQITPWKIINLHIIFDGWLGSEILNISPSFFITSSMKEELENNRLTGYSISDKILVEKSYLFNELYPNSNLPDFWILDIEGIPTKQDFGATKNNELVVSQKALDVLSLFNLSISEISILEDF